MENTCLQYENSLTRQAEESMDISDKIVSQSPVTNNA